MAHRSRFNFGIRAIAALVALAIQLCIPMLRASHEAREAHEAHAAHAAPAAAEAAHLHHCQHEGTESDSSGSDGEHDESECPTCQQFVTLRAFIPLAVTMNAAPIGRMDGWAAPLPDAPFVSRSHHAPAVPRGPPCSC